MSVSAPVARTGTPVAPAAKVANAMPLPFQLASTKRIRQAFDTGNLVLGQNVSAIELPAFGGFLRYIELDITGTTAANAATVVFAADAPFSALSFIEFMPPSGDPPIIPHTGYQLMLWNKYGAMSQASPYSDPRRDVSYLATAGAGATGGSFHFTLRLPFEIDAATGYCAITNSASNKSYLINLIVAGSAAIYTTPPTTAPTVRVIGTMYYWDEPQAQTRQGTQQSTAPRGVGSFQQLRIDQQVVTPGDKIQKVNNGGPVLRNLITVLRTSAGARTNADIPATWDFMFNTRDKWLISDVQLLSDMAEGFGYQFGTGANGWGTAPNYDLANALDTGVRVWPYFQDFGNGGVESCGPRTQYQITADATLTQIRAISFGAAASTFEILTNLVRPKDSASLYADRLS